MLQKTGKDLLYGKYVGWLWFLDEIVLKKDNSICLIEDYLHAICI